MDKLMSLAANFDKDALMQQFAGHDDDSKEAVSKSLDKVEEKGVRQADESDIHQAKAAHDKVYKGDDTDADDEQLGKAAGVQAFKSYEEEESRSEDGAGGKEALVQMAIAEAMKMFGKGGGGGDKSTIMQTAITTAMGLFMSKQGGGGGSGGMQEQLMALLAGASGGGGSSSKKDDEEGGSSSGGGGGSTSAALGMLSSVGGEKGQALAGMLGKFM